MARANSSNNVLRISDFTDVCNSPLYFSNNIQNTEGGDWRFRGWLFLLQPACKMAGSELRGSVAPDFNNKIRYALYVNPGS